MNEVVVALAPDRRNTLLRPRLRDSLFPLLNRWLREPLVHFLLIGIAVFSVYAYMHRGRGGVESSKQIVLSLDELRQMEMYFESQWHRQPTPEEFQAMVEDKVREEVLYREGLVMASIKMTPS
jgi:peptidyl-prolyl cis-trans isomerase C